MKKDKVLSVELLEDEECEMYDVGMENTPHTFFANDILVHNSAYLSNKPLLDAKNITDEEEQKIHTIKVAHESVDELNKFYDILMFKVFNCDKHVLQISGETIGKTAIWVRKKRYCIYKVYDLEKEKDVEKLHIKGLDVVRSSFPKAFQEFMSKFLNDLLKGKTKNQLDNDILNFKKSIETIDIESLAKNSSIKNISKYDKMRKGLVIAKGTPAHVKSALKFNDMLKTLNINSVGKIQNGEKIKWVYLKNNKYNLDSLAFRGYEDPVEIMDLISSYVDRNKLFDSELKNKLMDFYKALKWEFPNENEVVAKQFFEF